MLLTHETQTGDKSWSVGESRVDEIRDQRFKRTPVGPTIFRIEPFGEHVEGLSL